MKMLLISNENLAEAMLDSLKTYFSSPEVEAICFKYPNHLAAKAKLKAYFDACQTLNPKETFLVLCDNFGSTAFNGATLLLQKNGLAEQSLLLCGMNLPMVFKLYGLKDSASLELCRSLYEGNGSFAYDVPLDYAG